MRFWLSILAALTTTAAASQEARYQCWGHTPDWTLSIDGPNARFDFIRQTQMTIPQFSHAEGRDWPRAMTLVSDDFSTTAIVVLRDRSCNLGEDIIYSHEVDVLTQRSEQPVLLTGCCRATGP